MAERPLRTFFAAWPDVEVCARLAAHAKEIAGKMQGRAPVAANLHLTLVFVGDVAASELPSLRAVGQAAAALGSPFVLRLDRGGMFRASGIAWIGASSSPDDLVRVAQGLTAGLSERGFVVELREFVPHITLARRCRRAGPVTLDSPIVWPIGRIALYASEAGVGGPQYRELEGWPLGGRAIGQ